MSNQNPNTELYEFGPFRVSVVERVLTKGQHIIPLTPKAFDTLVVLVRNSGHVVEKEELLKEVWPDTFVEEGVLAVNVAALRKALNEGDEGRTYIETVPRRGYRFIGEVKPLKKLLEDKAAAQKAERRKRSLATQWGLATGLLALVLAAVGWFVSGSRPTSIPPLSTPILLTSFPGTEQGPTFSPDRSQIAFSWNGERQNNFDIYVKLIDQADAVRLTTDPARDMFPAWSPDGRYIAFARDKVIFLIPPTGGAERKVADIQAIDIEWTRDSKSLVVSAGASRRCCQLLLLSVDTGEAKELTSLPQRKDYLSGDVHVAVSPNGLDLAIARAHNAVDMDLYLMPLAGGEPRRLTQNEFWMTGIAWTPDGREIVYARRGGGMWRRSVRERSDSPSRRIEGVEPSRIGGPVISRLISGSEVRLAYQRWEGDINIWVKDTQDSSTPARKLLASTRHDSSPQFSPDGSQIAFVSNGFGRSPGQQLWVAKRDGSKPLQLTFFPPSRTNAPRWSPDGSCIVFSSLQNDNRDLYSISPNGSSLRRLTSWPSDEGRPSWSRDGRWIYFFSKRTGNQEIWRIPAEGGEAVQLTVGGGHESFESPDGKLLYYEDYGIGGLRVISTKNLSAPQKGTVVLGAVRPGFWAVAQKGIYFVDIGDQLDSPGFQFFVPRASEVRYPIKFYDFGIQKIIQIGWIEKEVERETSFSVTWDGRYVAWSQFDRIESDLMLVEDFR